MILGIISLIITILFAGNSQIIIKNLRSDDLQFFIFTALIIFLCLSIIYNLIIYVYYYIHVYRRRPPKEGRKIDPNFKPLPKYIRKSSVLSEAYILFTDKWGRKRVWIEMVLNYFFLPKKLSKNNEGKSVFPISLAVSTIILCITAIIVFSIRYSNYPLIIIFMSLVIINLILIGRSKRLVDKMIHGVLIFLIFIVAISFLIELLI